MNDILLLSYENGGVLEGFRRNDAFISKHWDILCMLSDKSWRENPFMNQEEHLSSPTRMILSRYVCNILSALFIDISENTIKEIIVQYDGDLALDIYSRYIFLVIERATSVNVFYKKRPAGTGYKQLTVSSFRTCVKRGLYDRFILQDKVLDWMYCYYKQIFYGELPEFCTLLEQYSRAEDDYERYIVIKSVINQGIRKGEKRVVRYFLEKLKDNNFGEFDYINSFSYYLLSFFSKEESVTYLEKHVDVHKFLNSKQTDFQQSLVLKNYASLLPLQSDLKRKIMIKCLEQTPQDVDLWKEWFRSFASSSETNEKATEIFKAGYSELELVKLMTIKTEDTSSIVRVIVLCNTSETIKMAKHLISLLRNQRLKIILGLYLENFCFSPVLKGDGTAVGF